MFLSNKYTDCYWRIIEKAKVRIVDTDKYYEKHHIIPKSLGGTDEKCNLVPLTAKEHFVAHHLLTKMCRMVKHTNAMWCAFFFMHSNATIYRYNTSRTYVLSKEKMAETKRQKIGNKNHYFGKKHSEEIRAKMRLKRKGRVCRRDWTVYDFYHNDHGLIKMTRYDLCQTYDVCHKGIHCIATGYTKTHRGWRCLNPEPPKTSYK